MVNTADTLGFLMVGLPASWSPARSFPLEGTRDIFVSLQQADGPPTPGPVCPSLGSQLLPALDALAKTVEELGKHPTPHEVDRSNLRRLVRAVLTVVSAHRDSFPKKGLKAAARELTALASAIGRYKDQGILEDTVRQLFPNQRGIEAALAREHDRRAEKFSDSWRHFRKEGLARVLETLSRPGGHEELHPRSIEREDRRRLRAAIESRLDEVERVGLLHEDPEDFHEGRKSLRRLLHACMAAREALDVRPEDIQALSSVVDGLGVAQDLHIAGTWLEKKGFDREAAVARPATTSCTAGNWRA
ncbi:MAG: CHAD domain-containing protein [Candidatus Eremiobacterota bacterium]